VAPPSARSSRREIVARLEAAAASELVGRAARQLRRRSTVVVPSVIGMSWGDAQRALSERGLIGIGPDPVEATAPVDESLPGRMVVSQSPEAGAKVPPGSSVTLWVERGGGGAGVREPRRPTPTPGSAREMRDEPRGEAVG